MVTVIIGKLVLCHHLEIQFAFLGLGDDEFAEHVQRVLRGVGARERIVETARKSRFSGTSFEVNPWAHARRMTSASPP